MDKYSTVILGISLQFIASCAEAFSLMQFHLSIFAFVPHAFVGHIQKIIHKTNFKKIFLCFLLVILWF